MSPDNPKTSFVELVCGWDARVRDKTSVISSMIAPAGSLQRKYNFSGQVEWQNRFLDSEFKINNVVAFSYGIA